MCLHENNLLVALKERPALKAVEIAYEKVDGPSTQAELNPTGDPMASLTVNVAGLYAE